MKVQFTTRSLSLAATVLFMAPFVAKVANAFTVGCLQFLGTCISGDGVHEEITTKALTAADLAPSARTFNGAVLPFDRVAVDEIVKAAWVVDSTEWKAGKVHFDSESFPEGQERLWAMRKQIVYLLLAGGSGSEPRKLLGEALHTVQDFYAHSSWIELGNTTIARLGESDTDGPPVNLVGTGIAIPSQTCSPSGLLPTNILTSEYPWPSAAIGTTSYISGVPLGGSKCAHGISTSCNDLSKCNPIEILSAGVNKDSDRRQGFVEARLKAVDATTRYVTLILNDLQQQPSLLFQSAVCRLLGQPLTKCIPPGQSPPRTFVYTGGILDQCDEYGYPQPCDTPASPIIITVTLSIPANFSGTIGTLGGPNEYLVNLSFRGGQGGYLGAPNFIHSFTLLNDTDHGECHDRPNSYIFKFSSGTITGWYLASEPPSRPYNICNGVWYRSGKGLPYLDHDEMEVVTSYYFSGKNGSWVAVGQ